MIKIKTFVMANTFNPSHHDRLDNAINSFLEKNDVEVIDIKYSSSLSADNGSLYFIHSAMVMYKTND